MGPRSEAHPAAPSPGEVLTWVAVADVDKVALVPVLGQGFGQPVLATSSDKISSIDVCVWLDTTRLACVATQDQRWFTIDTAGQVESKPLPEAARWKAKNRGGDYLSYRAEELIVTATGEIWLGRCVWAVQGDGDPCAVLTYLRIDAPSQQRATAPAPRLDRASLPPVSAPKGYSAAEITSDEGYAQVECQGPKGQLALPEPDAQAESARGKWLAEAPALLLIEADVAGLDTAEPVDYVIQDCTTVLGDGFVSGEADFWMYHAPTLGPVIMRSGTRVGPVSSVLPQLDGSPRVFMRGLALAGAQ